MMNETAANSFIQKYRTQGSYTRRRESKNLKIIARTVFCVYSFGSDVMRTQWVTQRYVKALQLCIRYCFYLSTEKQKKISQKINKYKYIQYYIHVLQYIIYILLLLWHIMYDNKRDIGSRVRRRYNICFSAFFTTRLFYLLLPCIVFVFRNQWDYSRNLKTNSGLILILTIILLFDHRSCHKNVIQIRNCVQSEYAGIILFLK